MKPLNIKSGQSFTTTKNRKYIFNTDLFIKHHNNLLVSKLFQQYKIDRRLLCSVSTVDITIYVLYENVINSYLHFQCSTFSTRTQTASSSKPNIM